MYNRAANVYRKVYAESAPPTRILDELLGALLDDFRGAAACIAARDAGGKGRHVGRALAIVGELDAALDANAAPELVRNLRGLYAFVRERLLEASVKMKAGPLGEAERVVAPLREAFQAAARR